MAIALGNRIGNLGQKSYTAGMPEKSFNEVPRMQRELYEKGLAALERNNLDYALVIFNQILEKEPGFYECREKLRATQLKKAGSGGGFFKKVFGAAGNSPGLAKAQIQLRTNAVDALKSIEDVLNSDPNNVMAHKVLADAALACDFPKTAVLSLEMARKNSPKDQEIALRLAQALVAMGNPGRAMSIYRELQKLNPLDTELDMEIKNLTASLTMAEGGYDAIAGGNASYRDILKDKAEAVSLEQANRVEKAEDIALRVIAELEERHTKEPKNLKVIRDIAQLYTQIKQYDRAIEFYNRIIAEEGMNDPSLEKAMTDTITRKYDDQIKALDSTAPNYQQQLAALKAERQEYMIKDARRRVEKYPNDLALRFELGNLLYNAGKISEAIPELQRAQTNPHLRIRALIMLGNCFMARNNNDSAVRQFQTALKEKVGFDDERKDILYGLGLALDKMGKKEESIEQFKHIMEVDFGYKDVAARVDAFHAGN
jgi:tetratricopeptide (TPR) repeat protein